jgi:predicted site-specific integrase-resolvase
MADIIGENWLSLPQAAKAVRITRGHLRRWILKGKLPTKKIVGRFYVNVDDLRRLVEVVDYRGEVTD